MSLLHTPQTASLPLLLRFLPYSKWLPYLDANGLPQTPEVFYSALDDFLNNSMEGFGYTNNFVFERNAAGNITWIKAARMQAFYNPLANTSDYVKAMVDVRKRIAEVPQVRWCGWRFWGHRWMEGEKAAQVPG